MNRKVWNRTGLVLAGLVASRLVLGVCWGGQEGNDAEKAALAAKRAAAAEAAKQRHEDAREKAEAAREAREDAKQKREAAKQRREARKEKAEAAKEAREDAKQKREEAKDRREAAKEKAETKAQEAKQKAETAKAKASDAADVRVDKRQDNQAKRIQHGISKGYLTADEISKLTAQQKTIADLEASFKADGNLSRNEFQQLRTELNEASRCIWAEKHDTEGNQMPTYRLDTNVFAKDNLTSKLANENLSAGEAKALLKDFHRIVELKRKLASDDLSDAERTALQAEYDTLLNQYFELR